MQFSTVIPVFNESPTIQILTERLMKVMEAYDSYEIIFVNDGSSDGSDKIIDELQQAHPQTIKVLHLRKNVGKSIALQVGFDHALGDIICMMDSDLQDQPEELPKLIDRLKKNDLDAISGWKINRQDSIFKTIPSHFFNFIIRFLSGLKTHDSNCGLKAFKRECLDCFTLYGQMHRFILIFINHYGYRVGEVPVKHAPRQHGYSKYGFKRFYHGWMDIMTIFFITRYLDSPLYFFGFYAMCAMGLGIFIGAFYLIMHFLSIIYNNPVFSLVEHPLWMLAPMLVITGLMVLFFGLIGELLTYYLTSRMNVKPFIKKEVGFDEKA